PAPHQPHPHGPKRPASGQRPRRGDNHPPGPAEPRGRRAGDRTPGIESGRCDGGRSGAQRVSTRVEGLRSDDCAEWEEHPRRQHPGVSSVTSATDTGDRSGAAFSRCACRWVRWLWWAASGTRAGCRCATELHTERGNPVRFRGWRAAEWVTGGPTRHWTFGAGKAVREDDPEPEDPTVGVGTRLANRRLDRSARCRSREASPRTSGATALEALSSPHRAGRLVRTVLALLVAFAGLPAVGAAVVGA